MAEICNCETSSKATIIRPYCIKMPFKQYAIQVSFEIFYWIDGLIYKTTKVTLDNIYTTFTSFYHEYAYMFKA